VSSKPVPVESAQNWTFLSNHAHVLVCVAKNPDVRLSEVAELVGVRERTAHRIVHELIDAGYISVTKVGRNNVYSVDLEKPLRHPLEAEHNIHAIVAPLLKKVKRS
jgi:DNA-binding IclR family transcriptional regulator